MIRHRRLAVATCAMGTLTVNINNTSLNLVLPEIRGELSLDLSMMQWVSTSYVLALGAFTMLGGALGDRFPKRRVLTAGLLVYILGSLLGGLSQTAEVLIASRVCAAAGAATLVPVGLAVLRVIARTPSELARYMSYWGLTVGLGMAMGPVAGGIITDLVGWRAFFGFMTVLGIIYLVSVRAFLPELQGSTDRRIDLWGHGLLGVTMLAITGFFIELGTTLVPVLKIALGALAVLLTALWWRRNRTSHWPVVPPTVFRDRDYSVSMLVAFINYFSLGATLFITALLLQDVYRMSPAAAGLSSVPLAASTALGALWAGRASSKAAMVRAVRRAAQCILAGVVVVAGSGVLVTYSMSTATVVVCFAVGSAAMGFGFGAANTPVNYLSMLSLPKTVSGVAGSSASASRQLGQSTGIATSGLLLGLGVSRWGPADALSFLFPGLEIALMAVLLITVPRLYRV